MSEANEAPKEEVEPPSFGSEAHNALSVGFTPRETHSYTGDNQRASASELAPKKGADSPLLWELLVELAGIESTLRKSLASQSFAAF